MVQIKTITTGASEEEVIFDKFNFLKGAKDTIYIWVRNFGDSDIYMSDHPGIVAGNDDVIKLGAKSVGLVTTAVDNKIYILGASTLECHAQFFAECPFRGVGSGGGGGGFTPTQVQLDAMNSGITSSGVAQIATNTSDISDIFNIIGDINDVLEEVL